MHTYNLPNKVYKFIDKYFNLRIKGFIVSTPYYINKFGLAKHPVAAGKGDPYEIEEIANEKLKSVNVSSEVEIYNLLSKHNIGIDCSGLVFNIYKYWLSLFNYDIKNYLSKVHILNIRKYFSRKFKPQSSINANELTSLPFSNKLERIVDVLPGDLIRTRGGKHVLFITRVVKNEFLVKEIEFVHSAAEYQRNGIRKGLIILDQNQSLNLAEWIDMPQEEKNFARLGYKEKINNNGIFRPNIPIFNDK